MAKRRQQSYSDYWRYYLRAHARQPNLGLHLLGTGLAIVLATFWTQTFEDWLFYGAIGCFFVFGWLGHILFQHELPDQFRNPIRSVISDARLFLLWCTARLTDELMRHGISSRGDVHVGPNRRGSNETAENGKRRQRRRSRSSNAQEA